MSELVLKGVCAGYGKVRVVHDIDLVIPACGRVALVGSNGAGKSTLVKVINGLLPLSAGEVLWDGRSLGRVSAAERVHAGIGTVPEGRALFPDCSVVENLEAAASFGEARRQLKRSRERVFELFPRLAQRADQRAATLSGGEQQMLAIGRAMMTLPRLMILDEPSIGLAPKVVGEIFTVLSRLVDEGLSLLLVEQNIRLSLQSVDHAFVLKQGRITMSGASSQLLQSDEIRVLYLGS